MKKLVKTFTLIVASCFFLGYSTGALGTNWQSWLDSIKGNHHFGPSSQSASSYHEASEAKSSAQTSEEIDEDTLLACIADLDEGNLFLLLQNENYSLTKKIIKALMLKLPLTAAIGLLKRVMDVMQIDDLSLVEYNNIIVVRTQNIVRTSSDQTLAYVDIEGLLLSAAAPSSSSSSASSQQFYSQSSSSSDSLLNRSSLPSSTSSLSFSSSASSSTSCDPCNNQHSS